jgi:hypothetical protein
MFLGNVGWLSADYTTLHPRRQYPSKAGRTWNQTTQMKYASQKYNVTHPRDVRIENELHIRQSAEVKSTNDLSKCDIRNQLMPSISCIDRRLETREESSCEPLTSMLTLGNREPMVVHGRMLFQWSRLLLCVGQWVSWATVEVFGHDEFVHIVVHANRMYNNIPSQQA